MKWLNSLIGYTLLLLAGLSCSANAEQKIVKDNWDIHYIAFPSTFLEPSVAKAYDLQRSRYQALINLSVLGNQNGMKPQRVFISGTAKNLLGQTTQLEFTRVDEKDATYYLAQLKYSNEEIFNFDITIRKGDRVEKLKFKKKFYVD